MMSTPARKRLMRDFKRLQQDPPAGISGAPQDNNIMLWNAVIFGPDDTPWDGGTFKLFLQFAEDYPNKPPTVRFVSRMFHPNIYADGSICLDILQNQWSPIYDVAAILTSIQRTRTSSLLHFSDFQIWKLGIFIVLGSTEMGKSPAKWIKTLLLGKKSSKSNFSKGREKLNSANKGEVLVSSKVTKSDLSVDPPSISAPIPVSSTWNAVDSDKGIPAQVTYDGHIPSPKADGSDATAGGLGNPENSNKIKLDQAAATVQAAFRGLLSSPKSCSLIDDEIICWKARRAFRTLKGIIRLQALIRGHMVRRQAVATLCCTWGIVKLQALARGQKVRCSAIAVEVQGKHLRLLQGSESLDSVQVSASSKVKNLSNNVFAQKLLASSPAILPLGLQYGPEEPNSSWQWLQRWTKSRFWRSPSKPIRSGKTNCSVRKPSNGKVVNGSSHSTSEYEKNKQGLRRGSGNSAADSVCEHPQNELERVKRNLRKLSDSSKEVSDKCDVVNDKTKKTQKKPPSSNDSDVSEHEYAEKMRDVPATLSKLSNLEADLKLSSEDASLDEPNICPAVDLPDAENNGKIEQMPVTEELSSKDEQVSDESSKANKRRDSFPAKIDNQANGFNNNPKVPSYMAPTESVKARLRGQGSPRFTHEGAEKDGLNRRHSLPSSTNNNKSSPSSRAQTRVRVAGKGSIFSDKSQSSSKDANDKALKGEWRSVLICKAGSYRSCEEKGRLHYCDHIDEAKPPLGCPHCGIITEIEIAVYLQNNAMTLEKMMIDPRAISYKGKLKIIYPPTLPTQCQVPPRVPPNTSVGHQGSEKSKPHNPSEVIKGTPVDS
ncbi:hypothetical protein V6N11_021355 [Hibiscus sabdariffa]|uniref:UBC core domain-containing protein n=1 Tax=Hibiscus sabdariffa TaxID=183260 RepID=A0ABR2NM71_9ROSI